MADQSIGTRRRQQISRGRRTPSSTIPPVNVDRPASIWSTLDKPLLAIVGLLLTIGAGMIFSTTFDGSLIARGSSIAFFVQEHLRNVSIALVGMVFFAVVDYRFWKRFAPVLLLITLGALVAVLIFGDDVFGARRSLIGGRFQPSELAEFTVVVYMAAWLGAKNTKVDSIFSGLIPFAILVSLIAGLVALQPDLSSSAIIGLTAGMMYFVAGARWSHLVSVAIFAGIAGLLFVQTQPYAQNRLQSYQESLLDPTQANYQTQQAIIAFVKGGWLGVGLGQGEQKINALPAPHTDSIFAALGEELGVLGASFVVFLFILFVIRGFQIARRAVDPFGSLLAIGFTLWVAVQALLNIAVMTNVIPTSGVPLPFISFGGSALLVLMISVGLLLSVSRVAVIRESAANRRKDGTHYDWSWGTGGHVYPALAVAEVLHKPNPAAHSLVFVGTRGSTGIEKQLVDKSGIAFDAYEAVYAGPVAGVNPLRALLSLFKMLLGLLQAVRFMMRHKPQAILLTGGWANVPVALAARLFNVPIVVYLPDIEPGKTIRLLARFARIIATTTADSQPYFDKPITVTGYPLRQQFIQNSQSNSITTTLDTTRKTLLVFGGSRGARSINTALIKCLPNLLDLDLQIIHITGKLEWERVQATLTQDIDLSHYHAYPYIDDMATVMASADIVVSRAGASVLGEFTHYGLPSILVPYPHAWRYQKVNADYLVGRGAAIRLDDEKLAEELTPTLASLLQDETRYHAMQTASKAAAVEEGASLLAHELLQLTESGTWLS